MKNIIKTILFIATSIAISSCSKNDDAPTPEPAKPITVTTIAGSTQGDFDAVGTNAKIFGAQDFVQDSQGNIYFADTYSHKIKKMKPSGAISTFAGSGGYGAADGTASQAEFKRPNGIAIDPNGNLFIAEIDNYKIRKIKPNGHVSTFAGSTYGDVDVVQANGSSALNAKFTNLSGLICDASGNLFVCDFGAKKIKKITANGDSVTTFAGSIAGSLDGTGINAQFSDLQDIIIDKLGNFYVTDFSNNKIRKITPTGVVSTFAGSDVGDLDDLGNKAKLNNPNRIAINNDNELFVTDSGNSKVKKITPSGQVTTIAGNSTRGDVDGTATEARFGYLDGILVDVSGNLIIGVDYKIKKITLNPNYALEKIV